MQLDMNYTKVYGFMTHQLMLEGKELLVFAMIYSFHEAGTRCSASVSYIAHRACASERSIERAIRSLESKGLITVSGTQKMPEYKVNEPAIHRLASEVAASGGGFPDGF